MISKVTMYDSLAIVGPGGAILFLLSSLCQRAGIVLEDALDLYYDLDTALQLALLTLLSYLIGLLWHKMSERVFEVFRNEEVEIEECRERIIGEMKKRENRTPLLSLSYYCGYYKLMSENMLGPVPILEAQVAFLRNCILIVPIAAFWLFSSLPNSNDPAPYGIVTFAPLFVVLTVEIVIIRGMFCKAIPMSFHEGFSFILLIYLFASVLALSFLVDCVCLKVLATLAVQGLLFVMMRRIQTQIYSLVWEGDAYIP